jgi:hypothetical protein
MASASRRVANGALQGIRTVRESSFLNPAASIEASPAAAAAGARGFKIVRNVYMTSSAVSCLPLWKVMPGLIRSVHWVALALGVSSSARMNTGCAAAESPTSGS